MHFNPEAKDTLICLTLLWTDSHNPNQGKAIGHKGLKTHFPLPQGSCTLDRNFFLPNYNLEAKLGPLSTISCRKMD